MIQKIRFNTAQDVKEFVEAADACPFDVDISYDRIVIDAKSIMGVMGMDLGRDLTVHCHGECESFERAIARWAVE